LQNPWAKGSRPHVINLVCGLGNKDTDQQTSAILHKELWSAPGENRPRLSHTPTSAPCVYAMASNHSAAPTAPDPPAYRHGTNSAAPVPASAKCPSAACCRSTAWCTSVSASHFYWTTPRNRVPSARAVVNPHSGAGSDLADSPIHSSRFAKSRYLVH
jgi:hypothetical protein